jgi:Leucine-rich repeat (LRR) protein
MEENDDVRVVLQKQAPKLTRLPEDIDATATHLDVSENQLESLASLDRLSSLRVLDASDNRLTALPEEIGECGALDELLLYKNQLKKLPPGVGRLSKLRLLNLFNNKLLTFPVEIGALSMLEEVNAAANKLGMIRDESFSGWRNVTSLNLYDNNLVKLGSLAPLVSLVELKLYNNNLVELPTLPPETVEVVDAHNNRLTDLDDAYFAGAPRLRRLLLTGNQLTTLPSSLRRCAKLQFLQVADNQISALSMSLPPPAAADGASADGGHSRRFSAADPWPVNALGWANSPTTPISSLSMGLPAPAADGGAADGGAADGIGGSSAADGSVAAAGAPCWPELETLFLERNPIACLPPELPLCTQLTRCNLSGLPIDEGDAVASAVLKLVLAKPGGSFWTVRGRRWMSDEARAAGFANQRCARAVACRRSVRLARAPRTAWRTRQQLFRSGRGVPPSFERASHRSRISAGAWTRGLRSTAHGCSALVCRFACVAVHGRGCCSHRRLRTASPLWSGWSRRRRRRRPTRTTRTRALAYAATRANASLRATIVCGSCRRETTASSATAS